MLILASLSVSAQTIIGGAGTKKAEKITPPKSPMLWKVTKQGGVAEAYLFGTVHFSGSSVKQLHPKAEAAFKAAKRVYFEGDLSFRGAEKVQEYVKRSKGSSLLKSLGTDLSRESDTVLQAYAPKLNIKMFDQRKTWAFWTTLSYVVNCGHGGVTLDTHLHRRAMDKGKSVYQLESLDEQLGGLNRLSEKEQLMLVRGYVKYLSQCLSKKVHPSRDVFEAYIEGNEDKLIKAVNRSSKDSGNTSSVSVKLKKIMLDARNKRMAHKIDLELMKFPKKSHFFAVGVSHYLGRNSIVDLLKKRGYTITRIYR